VRYVGEPIAMVVETSKLAKDAAESIFVYIDPLPAQQALLRRRMHRNCTRTLLATSAWIFITATASRLPPPSRARRMSRLCRCATTGSSYARWSRAAPSASTIRIRTG
jgi:hypothetical protein